MFRLFGPKRHNAPAIAHAVLNAADPCILESFVKEFASSDAEVPRVIFSVIVFAYCWSRNWAVSKQDARVLRAYADAAEFIVSRFKSAGKLVKISDYVVSELEMSRISLDFLDYFRERIPPKFEGSASEMIAQIKAHSEA